MWVCRLTGRGTQPEWLPAESTARQRGGRAQEPLPHLRGSAERAPRPRPEERGERLSPRPSRPPAQQPRGGTGCRDRLQGPAAGPRLCGPGGDAGGALLHLGSAPAAAPPCAPPLRARAPALGAERGGGARGAPGRRRRAGSRERGGRAARGRCAVPRGARRGRAPTRARCRQRRQRQPWRSSRRASAPRTAGEEPPLPSPPGPGWVRERVTQRR